MFGNLLFCLGSNHKYVLMCIGIFLQYYLSWLSGTSLYGCAMLFSSICMHTIEKLRCR